MRDYDPTTGRYIQADPLGLVDGASVYGYALQKPGRYVDPRGELSLQNIQNFFEGAASYPGALYNCHKYCGDPKAQAALAKFGQRLQEDPDLEACVYALLNDTISNNVDRLSGRLAMGALPGAVAGSITKKFGASTPISFGAGATTSTSLGVLGLRGDLLAGALKYSPGLNLSNEAFVSLINLAITGNPNIDSGELPCACQDVLG